MGSDKKDSWLDDKKEEMTEQKFEELKNVVRYECRSCNAVVSVIKPNIPKKRCGCGGKFEMIKEMPRFFYYAKSPKKAVTTLKELESIIVLNFPSVWFETKACLSIFCSLVLKNLNGCPSLNLVGNPSGEKTTVLSFFYGDENSYMSDDFSPRAFVSHSAKVSEGELESIDLLPKIKNKVLITPELAPLFEAPKEHLLENFSMLTRVLDGEGLNRDTGTHGHRGYSGDYKFAWLGATTPIRSSVWQIMGKIGNRLFFLNMSDKNRTDEDYLKMFSGSEYEEKIKECRGAVRSFLNNFFLKYKIRSFEWKNEQQDIFVLKEIIKYSKLLSKLRGSLTTWKSGDEKGDYEYTFPIIEEPPRAINSLRNIARGHALIHERDYLTTDDLKLVRAVCLSSMPYDRFKFLQLLMKHEGRLSTETIESELNCGKDTALRTMKVFEVLGVVDVKTLPIGEGRPLSYVELKEEFRPLLNHTQDRNDAINNKSQENNIAYVKIQSEENNHAQGINSAINSLSQEIKVVSVEELPEADICAQVREGTINGLSRENNPVNCGSEDSYFEQLKEEYIREGLLESVPNQLNGLGGEKDG